MTGLITASRSTAIEEEPPDLFCSIASLIVEGRVPKPGDARSFGEGPHAPPHPGSPGIGRHKCSSTNDMCKKDENFRKHILLLWQNNVPVSIEVLLCSDCRVGKLKTSPVEYSTIPEPGSILLEQWTVSMLNDKQSHVNYTTSRGLFQAVRSYLHFSQLSAWYTKSAGTEPRNIVFRITIPGENFSSKFTSTPEEHVFPYALFGDQSAVHVSVKSLPRTEKIPAVVCRHSQESDVLTKDEQDHGKLSKSSSSSSDLSATETIQAVSTDDEGKMPVAGSLVWKELDKSPKDLRKLLVRNRMFECANNRPSGNNGKGQGAWNGEDSTANELPRSDSMDSMLGNSLIDPPQSLQEFPPKKYQSPSRCGSPSLEAPEHLLFGSSKEQEDAQIAVQTKDRLARQDLLRRRDLNLYHGLHPRVLPLGLGNQPPRLSLPTKAMGNFQPSSSGRVPGPYRAFPPERTPSCKTKCSLKNDSNKCTIPGKHICEVHDQTYASRRSRWDLAHNNDQSLWSSESSRSKSPNPENLGAKKKTKKIKAKCEEQCNDDSEEGGIEVAEYVNVPDVGLYPYTDEKHQTTLAQKGLDELLDELQISKTSPCSSRRSSIKDEDSLFPHNCSKMKKKKKVRGGGFLDNILAPVVAPLPPIPPVTQVYRAETEINTAFEPKATNPPLDKSDILLGAIIRTGELNRDSSYDSETERDADNEEEDDVCSVLSDEEPTNDQIEGKSDKIDYDRIRSLSENLNGKKVTNTPEFETNMGKLKPLDMSFDGTCSPTGISGRGFFDEWTCDDDGQSPDDDGPTNKAVEGYPIPTTVQMDSFRKTLNSATSMVFHRTTGLPLSSSPAPLRKGKTNFDYDSSISTPTDIKRALFSTKREEEPPNDKENHKRPLEDDDNLPSPRKRHPSRNILSASAPATITSTNLLGSFEESVLNGRLEPVSTVEGFTAEIGASGSFHPKHKTLPVTVFFYTLCENSNISSPYLGHINLGRKGYRVPQKGTIQVTLFNPLGTVVKMFVVMYDLSDMPPNSQTFLRQRTLYMPTDTSKSDSEDSAKKWLRYLVHLRFASSKSGKLYLHTDIRMIIFRKSDLDTATDHNPGKGFELRSFTRGPSNPKFSPRR